MPVPGPRTQQRPLPGYDNPGNEQPHRLNQWKRPGPVQQTGRSPATMFTNLRGNILATGTIRRLWRQTTDYIAARTDYSWTTSTADPIVTRGFGITTALRYMTRNVYARAGTDATRFSALHTKIHPRVNSKPVSRQAGGSRNRPTVRNRLTSFGSRVPPLNSKVSASQND